MYVLEHTLSNWGDDTLCVKDPKMEFKVEYKNPCGTPYIGYTGMCGLYWRDFKVIKQRKVYIVYYNILHQHLFAHLLFLN